MRVAVHRSSLWFVLIPFLALNAIRAADRSADLHRECSRTLVELCDALLRLQVNDSQDANYGALACPSCDVFHTRAGEAVFPLVIAYRETGESRYLEAARRLGLWLIRQQQPDGSWKEMPEEWTGTTTDQLLMMTAAYPLIEKHLSSAERQKWKESVLAAADYLTRVMSPRFASINYCATTTASLALVYRYFGGDRYLMKARQLAQQVVSKMDDDGFITGEGGRVHGVKYGVDLGYDIDMSLWGLALYARLTSDTLVDRYVRRALRNHLFFVYPDGSIDGSWGIRSNKWTTYGSATADGCQILFSLFAGLDPVYRTAALRNLQYLRGMMRDGIVGYGPHYWLIFDAPPCIYPTFVRAKNLAMAIRFGQCEPGPLAPLPAERRGWIQHFRTVDVVLVRTENFVATVTAYRYKDLQKGHRGKYMHRPTGGAVSNLWVDGHGFLQVSSQTHYERWEPMHFPEMGEILPLTSRIEYTDSLGYFTNLYEFDARLTVDSTRGGEYVVRATGELRDQRQLQGGVAYRLTHVFGDDYIERSVRLRFHDRRPEVRIVEPIVWGPDVAFRREGEKAVRIVSKRRSFLFELLEGDAKLSLGEDAHAYRWPYPAVRCYPITLQVSPPEKGFLKTVRYRIRILD